MRAVVYKGPFQVEVDGVPDPKIQHPNDVIVKITSSCICGSDLHMYEGRTAAEPGIVFGHENMGVIEEVGSAVTDRKVGDRVVMPFNVACGYCKNCLGGFTGFCITVNPGFAGGAYGYVAMGPYTGGQAEYLRVPFADFNCLPLPAGKQNEADYALLADIFPTGYHGAELAGVKPGDIVLKFDGKDIKKDRDLPRIVAGTKAGKSVELEIWRANKIKKLRVKLGELESYEEKGQAKVKNKDTNTPNKIEKLGMQLVKITPSLRDRYKIQNKIKGVLILNVESNSLAAERGLKAGDIILAIVDNDAAQTHKKVSSPMEIIKKIDELKKQKKNILLLYVKALNSTPGYVPLKIAE